MDKAKKGKLFLAGTLRERQSRYWKFASKRFLFETTLAEDRPMKQLENWTSIQRLGILLLTGLVIFLAQANFELYREVEDLRSILESSKSADGKQYTSVCIYQSSMPKGTFILPAMITGGQVESRQAPPALLSSENAALGRTTRTAVQKGSIVRVGQLDFSGDDLTTELNHD